VIAGCTGISGSVVVGRHCMIGGGVGIVGHISICDHVTISGMTLVAKSITRPGTYTSGLPMMPHAQWLRSAAHLRRLDRIAGRANASLPGEDRERDDDD
jgi:UDP-3-O-[3-hydroxymyristoyl] glucosamine N-acyltransferase